MENTIKTIQIEARGYQDWAQTEKANGSRPFWEPRGGPGGGPGPRATPFWTPPFRTTLPTHPAVFGVFPRRPPGTPPWRKTTYFQWILILFWPPRAPKGPPKRPLLNFARDPGPPRGPKKNCFFVRARPLGPHGGPRGTQEGEFRGYGPPNSGQGSRLTLLPHVICNIDTLGANVAVA